MRGKIGQKVCIFALMGTMSLANISSVAASTILDEVQLAEDYADHAEDISYSLLRGNDLNYGAADIAEVSSHEVNITGITQCHHVCDTVYLELYLEQKTDVGYSTYKSWEYTASDVTKLMRSLNILVPSGHYYRLRGYHAVSHDGSWESTTTLTSGVYVG